MKKTIDTTERTVTFTFDQTSAPGTPPIVFRADRVHPDNRAMAELFGFAARLGDAAALSRDPAGKAPSETERFAAVLGLVEHYESGVDRWTIREPGTGRATKQNATIAAIAAKRGCTYDEAEAYVAAKMLAELED